MTATQNPTASSGLVVASFVHDATPIAWQRAGRGNGATFTPARVRDHQKDLALACVTSMPPPRRPYGGPVVVTLTFEMPTRRPTDVDNLAKCVLDALNKVAYEDDKQVCDLHAYRRHTPGHGRTTVLIVRAP